MKKIKNEIKKSSWEDLREDSPYIVAFKSTSNDWKNPRKSKIHGKTVVIKGNNPRNDDIPSFEHGVVHVYDYKTDEYFGIFGVLYFARVVGLEQEF